MKRFSALLLIIMVGLTLSACSTLQDDTTQTYPPDEPFQATVFLQVKNIANFSTDQVIDWYTELNNLITAMETNTDHTATKITSANFRDNNQTTLQYTYTVDLTLTNVPATTIQKTVRPFKITYTQTVFNPISLLPASDTFTYVIGYTTTRRHSTANTEWIEAQNDGTYTYLWTSTEPVTMSDVYPNRPLYYLIILIGAIIGGGSVYLVSRMRRDSDCKITQKTLY